MKDALQHLTLATACYMTEEKRDEQFKEYNVTNELWDAYLIKRQKGLTGGTIK